MCCGFAAHCHGTEISPWFFHGFSQVTTHIAFQAARTGNLVRAHWEPPEGIGFWWFLISMLFNCARSHRMSCSRPVGALKVPLQYAAASQHIAMGQKSHLGFFMVFHKSQLTLRSRQLAQATWWGHIGNLQKELAFDDFWLACYSIVPARTRWVVAGQWGH